MREKEMRAFCAEVIAKAKEHKLTVAEITASLFILATSFEMTISGLKEK